MPTIHINDSLWELVEKGAVKAIKQTHAAITPQIFLQWCIDNGLENLDEIEIDQRARNPKKYRSTKNK